MPIICSCQLFGYNLGGTGRWVSLNLRKKKKPQAAGGKKKREKAAAAAAAAAAKQAEIEARIKEQEEEREAEAQASDDESHSNSEDDDTSDDDRHNRHSSAKQSEHNSPATSGTSTPQPAAPGKSAPPPPPAPPAIDDDDPELSRPLVRFNVMLAIQRNTLYLYGGIHETSDREYTLDDFYILQLDKLERWVRMRECKIEGLEWNESDEEDEEDSDDDDDDSDSDSDSEEEDEAGQAEGVEVDHLREDEEAADGQDEDDIVELLGDASVEDVDPAEIERLKTERDEVKRRAKEVLEMEEATKGKTSKSKKKDKDAKEAEQKPSTEAPTSTDSPSGPSNEPDSQAHLSTPNPGETLRQFFDRTRTFWTTQALNVHNQEEAAGSSNTRSGYGQSGGLGKELRTKGFSMASDRYEEYLPVLREIEKIQAQAGLDREEMRQSAAKAQNGPLGGGLGVDSRHRR